MASVPASDVPTVSSGPKVPLLRGRLALIGPGFSIVVLVLLAYLPALRGGFVWDDDSWTTKLVALLRDSSGLRSIWFQPTAMQQYYPLTGTTFWLDYHLWRFWPLPYHVENALLHALSALLFWRVLRRLQIQGAWLAAALFALHPVMVESTAWITERKNVLSLTLCLGAALAYGRYPLEAKAAAGRPLDGREGQRSLSYVLAVFLFLGALLAKPTVCSFPAVVLLLAWWRRGELRWRQDVVPTLPFFALALGMCAVTGWIEKTHVGAQGADYALTIPQRILIAGRAVWFYLGKLVWPSNLCFVYPRWKPDAGQWWQWLYPLTAVGGLSTLWLARGRIGRGPITALLFFVGTLSPMLGFVNVYFMRYSFVCDHWVYFPSLGLFALTATGLSSVVTARDDGRLPKGAAVGVLLLVLGGLTWRQAGTFAGLESQLRITIERNPECWFAYNNLGNALFRKGRVEEAIGDFQEAIRLKPDLAEAYTSLGVALASTGRLDEALGQFRHAIRLKPDYAEAYYDLGIALEQSGEPERALRQFQEAVRLKPGFAAAQSRLARELRRRGQVPPAEP